MIAARSEWSVTFASLKYGAGEVLVRGIELALVPLYTAFLLQAEYGIVEIARAITSTWVVVCMAGLNEAAVRHRFNYQDPEALARFSGTTTTAAVAWALLLTIVAMVFGPSLSRQWLPNVSFNPYLALALCIGGMLVVPTIVMAHLQASQRASHYVVLQSLQGVLMLAAIAYFVAVRKEGAQGQLHGRIVAAAVVAVASVWFLGRVPVGFDWTMLRRALKYGVPLAVNSLLWLVINYADRLILQRHAPLAEVGVYALGYNVAFALSVMISAYNRAWLPKLFGGSLSGRISGKEIARVTTHFTTLLLWGALTLATLAPDIIALISPPSYSRAALVVPFITMGYVFIGLYQMITNVIWLNEKTLYSLAISAAGAVVTVVLNLILVPIMGMMGAALSTLIAFGIAFAIAFVVSHRIHPIPYEHGRMLGVAALAVVLYFVASNTFPATSVWHFPGRIGLCLLYGCVVIGLPRLSRA